MKNSNFFKLIGVISMFVILLTACSNENIKAKEEQVQNKEIKVGTVEITDIHGTVKIPKNPKNVVALDNRTFETLSDWNIKLAAAPKPIMPADSPYVKDKSVKDIGSHSEPNLEIIAAVEPELVIVGQRFASYYDDIKELVPNAAVIDLNFDVSKNSNKTGENLIDGLKNSTISLGKIFDKNEEAKQLIRDFDNSIQEAKSSYNGEDRVMTVIVSGGNIGFSAPHFGRVFGPMYEIFEWKPALEVNKTSSNHQGDDISVEAIAQSNPDWIFVLDRDAAISSMSDARPANDVIDNSKALTNTKAIVNGNIIYAPNDTYTNESIQTYLELFKNFSERLSK